MAILPINNENLATSDLDSGGESIGRFFLLNGN